VAALIQEPGARLSFWAEIKRRHVFQVAVAYVVVAWILLQVVDVVNEPLNLPDGFETVVIVLMAIGLPLALVLAWLFDLTSKGVVRTPPTDEPPADAPPAASEAPAPTTAPSAPSTPREPLRNSVAVLPLENLSPNPNDAYFAAGIHEEILNQLTKIKALSVIARTSVKKYQETDKSIAEIAEELGVGTIMEGSVRYAGARVRVAAQLIDAATAKHIWSEVYERDLADVFAIQADVATKIAAALEAELSAAERQSVEKLPTDSPEAYAAYLRALAIYQEHGHTVGALPGPRQTIQGHLDQAIELDPNFALAYVSRARRNASRLNQDPGVYEDSESGRAELEALAIRDAEQALSIDPGVGAAHWILARIHQFNWRRADALAAYQRAVELSPNEPELLADFAVFLTMNDRCKQSLELAAQALRLDPNNPQVHLWVSTSHRYCGDEAATRADLRRAVELAPTFGMATMLLASQETALGNQADGLKYTQIAEHLLRDTLNPVFLAHFVANYARLGLRDEAQRLMDRLQEMAKTRRIPSAAWIQAYAALGDEEQTLHWLNVAADNPESYVGYFSLHVSKRNSYGLPVLDLPRCREARERLGFRD
jgi:adenylate cyclase